MLINKDPIGNRSPQKKKKTQNKQTKNTLQTSSCGKMGIHWNDTLLTQKWATQLGPSLREGEICNQLGTRVTELPVFASS